MIWDKDFECHEPCIDLIYISVSSLTSWSMSCSSIVMSASLCALVESNCAAHWFVQGIEAVFRTTPPNFNTSSNKSALYKVAAKQEKVVKSRHNMHRKN